MRPPLYITAPDGVRFRVHDQRWSAHGDPPATTIPPGTDPRAESRLFVTAARETYGVHLGRSDPLDVSEATLRTQLAAALRGGRRPKRGERVTDYLEALHAETDARAERIAAGDLPWWWEPTAPREPAEDAAT